MQPHDAHQVCILSFFLSPGNHEEDQRSFQLRPQSLMEHLPCACLFRAWPGRAPQRLWLALCLALGHDGRPRDCLPGAHGSRRLPGQTQLRGRKGGLAISWRMRRRQPGRGEGAVSGNPSPQKASESKGKEPTIHSFNKSSIGQLPPARPHRTGAGHMDTELHAMTGPCPPGVHVLCERRRE